MNGTYYVGIIGEPPSLGQPSITTASTGGGWGIQAGIPGIYIGDPLPNGGTTTTILPAGNIIYRFGKRPRCGCCGRKLKKNDPRLALPQWTYTT